LISATILDINGYVVLGEKLTSFVALFFREMLSINC
jgi:hypothetical protein